MNEGKAHFGLLLLYLTCGIKITATSWLDSPRYGEQYVGGFQLDSELNRRIRCTPCDEYRSNSIDDYRGNGADNLGYDWSPKAWGGLAFPKPKDVGRPPNEWSRGRDGRQMPQNWGEERPKCRGCTESWTRTDSDRSSRPQFWEERGQNLGRGWTSTTTGTSSWPRPTEPPKDSEGTVTSHVLGVMYRNDKRLPVEWPQDDGHAMRWDGFRNGMPWEPPTKMDRRSGWVGPDPEEEPGKRYSGWNDDRKDYYASRWSHGSPSDREWSGSGGKWNIDSPWSHQSGDGFRRPDDRGYGSSGSGLPFGSSYPHPNEVSTTYTTARPYPTNSWSSTSSTYSPNHYYYPPSNNYKPHRPETNTQRPYPEDRPGYSTTPFYRPSHQNPYRPQDNQAPWNYRPSDYGTNRPGQWSDTKPSQSYLPQHGRPPSRPGYDQTAEQRPNRPYGGTPSITIWNSRPNEYEPKPDYSGSKPPKGYYTGFITEIHGSGSKHPSDKYPPSDGYGYDPGYDKTSRPGYESNRFPQENPGGYNDRFPVKRPDYDRPGYDKTSRPGYESNRFPQENPGGYNDRFPVKRPDYDRPGYDKTSRPGYESNRFPQENPGGYNDRFPVKRPDYDRPHSADNYDRDRYPSNDRDRHPYRPEENNDKYPPRPGNSNRFGGTEPDPGTDTGAWNYGEDGHKDGTYRRSGGSYPPYKGGQYFTSGYLASASTTSSANQILDSKRNNDETTVATSQEE